MKINKALFLILLFSIFQISCNKKFNKLQKKGTVDEKYKAAIKYYQKADYGHAGILLEEITPLLKGDSTAERAHIYNAYCNYYQRSYTMSAYEFKTFYSTYNNSPFAQEAYYMYANSLYKDSPVYNLDQSSTLTAIDALQTFLNTNPTSKYASSCLHDLNDLRDRLERKAYDKCKLYFKTREPSFGGRPNYKASVVTIDNFKKDFPDSKYNEELAYLQIKSMKELADLSFYLKQKERYNSAINYYEKFIDKYPKSKYLKELEKLYSGSIKGLADADKTEKDVEKYKLEIAKEAALVKSNSGKDKK